LIDKNRHFKGHILYKFQLFIVFIALLSKSIDKNVFFGYFAVVIEKKVIIICFYKLFFKSLRQLIDK
jgi:hypothetical protein